MNVPHSRYRRGKKMLAQGGPWSMMGGENWQTAGDAAGLVGNLGVSLWDNISPADAYGYDKNLAEKSALKGLASGAAAGTSIAPGIGTAIGAVVGGVGGLITGGQKEREALEAKNSALAARREAITRIGNMKLGTYDSTGRQEEGSLYAMGGSLKQLNSDTVEVNGRTHAEGGVQLTPNAEVEDKETISGDYVFSDLLGFAKPHKRLAKQIGKIEKKPLNSERRTTLELLRKKEEVLKQTQEQVREEIGADLYDNVNRQLGGKVSGWAKHKDCGCH